MTLIKFISFSIFLQFASAFTISGTVKDAATGEPLPYTNIMVLNTDIGTASDINGYYIIPSVSIGDYTIQFMMIGFATLGEEIKISNNNIRVDVELNPKVIDVNEITVSAERTQFEEKVDLLLSEMDQELEKVFRDVNGVNSFFYKSQYSLDISEKIDEFEETEMSGFLKAVHSEGKVYEILTHCLKQYLDDLNAPEKRTIFRKVTLEKIEQAVKIIKDEIDTIGNIITLSRRVGINQNTLQSGFNRFYNVSVNEFIRNYRMEKAKELLLNTDLNITEITYKIGINSRSYFSKLFKEKYGMSPKVFQSKNREDSEAYKTA